MIRVTTRISYGARRRHLAVNQGGRKEKGTEGWYLQWAEPSECGYSYGEWIAGPFKTKREATEAKRALFARDESGDGVKS